VSEYKRPLRLGLTLTTYRQYRRALVFHGYVMGWLAASVSALVVGGLVELLDPRSLLLAILLGGAVGLVVAAVGLRIALRAGR
jgi:putative Ca2+/H+ antiporter (TMEM165/GDT1 family)